MISIVCVYNNERLLADFLLDSLNRQTAHYELITIDNTKNQCTSAAQALNWGGRKARGKYIMFVHQDIRLCSIEWLHDAERMLDSLPNLGVAGIAGRREASCILANLTNGTPPTAAGTYIGAEPVAVETLDECLTIVPRDVFNVLQFDEITCDGWHLYTVEYCVSSTLLGFTLYVLPFHAYHASRGTSSTPTEPIDRLISRCPMAVPAFLPKEYYAALKKVIKKHKNHVSKIHTVFGDWSTSSPVALQQMTSAVRKIASNILLSLQSDE
jgi:glycosyltransferase involved in cell wall biosynthesis